MVKSVDFAVRGNAGGVVYGSVMGDGGGAFVQMGTGEDISLNLRRASILTYTRDGDDLLVELADGRVIALQDFFAPGEGQENHLMISADGELAQVSLEDMGDGVMFAGYGSPEVSGDKWSPNDRLAFLDGDELLAPVVEDETTGMAAFAPALLGGLGGAGTAGVAAAGLAGAAVIGGGSSGGNGGGSGPIIPTVNDPNDDSTLTTNTENPEAVVSGTGEPGSSVDVTIGNQTEQTEIDEDGNWEVVFKDDTLPADGDYSSEVIVTAPDGTEYDLDGPDFLIDMTPPDVEITEGAQSTGDVENLEEYADGISIIGQGEAHASISVEVQGQTQETIVGEDGSWAVIFPQDQLPGGTYTTEMTVVATDIHGNSTTITDTLVVDTKIALTQTMTPGGADGVVNATELAAGVSIGGAVDAGSTVVVTLADGATVPGTVTNGSWSATIPASYLTGEGTASYTVSATDPNGNTTSLPGTVTYDTELNGLSFFTGTPNSQIADNVVNGAEGASGVAVTGTVEPGAQSVTLTLANGTSIPTTIAADGSWSANIPASYVTGEGALNYTLNAVDAYGNTLSTPISGAINYDTTVTNFSEVGQVTGDDIVNATEAAAGFTIAGTVEVGSQVVVHMNGHDYPATVDGASWSVTLGANDLGATNGTMSYTVSATDMHGNTALLNDGAGNELSFTFDLEAPDAPGIIGFTRDEGALLGLRTEHSENDLTFASVDGQGHVSDVVLDGDPAVRTSYTSYDFQSPVPNGSYLVVSDTDAAGNEAATLLVVDNSSAVTVDLSRGGLADFDFASIDLSFAPDASLTITEAQIQSLTGPDHTITIQGDANDHVTALGAQDTGETVIIDGHSNSVYTLGDATLILDDDISQLTI